MIIVKDNAVKKINNFWNHALFHPTDAVEDPWGKMLLDRFSADGAVKTVRVYAMLEDIVYLDENGNLQYDFRISDLRLDYLLSRGFDLLIALAGMPDCIAQNTTGKTSVSKNKTRYKGKMWNTSPPRDPKLWEEVCYEYVRHNIERYGIETVSKWHFQCFNEPDIPAFFMSELPYNASNVPVRLEAYCKMYEGFARGLKRASPLISIGGPALAVSLSFLDGLLSYIRENALPMDFISYHSYGTEPSLITCGKKPVCVANHFVKHKQYMEVIEKNGFAHLPVIIDEWGIAAGGFCNRDDYPELMFRETELFSSYYARLIHDIAYSDMKIEKMMICLSGQHEMVEDFTGFRNFFTLHFIAKPIYNAHVLASRLGGELLDLECDRENLFVTATKKSDGYAVLLTYSNELLTDDLPDREENLRFAEDIAGKKVTIWCIDRENTNPYRLCQRLGIGDPTPKELDILREEGRLKPLVTFVSDGEPITLGLSANCTYLVEIH